MRGERRHPDESADHGSDGVSGGAGAAGAGLGAGAAGGANPRVGDGGGVRGGGAGHVVRAVSLLVGGPVRVRHSVGNPGVSPDHGPASISGAGSGLASLALALPSDMGSHLDSTGHAAGRCAGWSQGVPAQRPASAGGAGEHGSAVRAASGRLCDAACFSDYHPGLALPGRLAPRVFPACAVVLSGRAGVAMDRGDEPPGGGGAMHWRGWGCW